MSISIVPPSTIPQSLTSILGVVYVHRKTGDGGDLYLTRFGVRYADLLEVENWYERSWFKKHRVRLVGTSAIFRVRTKEVAGRSMDLVVKNCRVGEDVPADTRTLLEFINTEFNSPWEEFSLVTELREGKYGSRDIQIRTQEPLAIYVPPETMQLWQSGRSLDRIKRIQARHPGIEVDILRQYKLVYGWIHGCDIVELLERFGCHGADQEALLAPWTRKATEDLQNRGYAVADMKASHLIIDEENVRQLEEPGTDRAEATKKLGALVEAGAYNIVDYELLLRTPDHERSVTAQRRHSYLDDQRNRYTASELPEHLKQHEVMGVPYVFGRAEATGGTLWVVGRNGRLFDYFLPERWRRTHAWKLSKKSDIYYTLTKDYVHVVWKASRVGEMPAPAEDDPRAEALTKHGYNSPFEEFSIAHELAAKGIGTVYVRAIYMTGSMKLEPSTDPRRYQSHQHLVDPDGMPVLREDHNYITVRGYFNGPDNWVAEQHGPLCRPVPLDQAHALQLIESGVYQSTFERIVSQAQSAGFDASLLAGNDVLIACAPNGELLRDASGELDARICNFELIRRIQTAPD